MNDEQKDFNEWLVNDYRMHVEEFEALATEEKAKVIEEYSYFYA
ncbi:hypothetical protein [Paenibacillus xylaniclasticus]|nr:MULTISPECIES: hypothetical protein [Paenibacillus]GFN32545.1 hypothetical protein PCURB6_28050 [Paenibacillus curdlanolyticus]